MKMKKSLLMVILLLAVSSVMAAMSYSSATVTSAMTGTVVSTNEALLALNAGEHNAVKVDDGVLKIDFNKGNKTGSSVNSYGLQKQSEYTWNKLFTVKNNSEKNVKVTIKTEKLTPGVKLSVRQGNGTWTKIDSSTSFTYANLPVATGNSGNNEIALDVKVEVESGASLGDFKPNLVVSGE